MRNTQKRLETANLTERLNENTKGVYIISATPFDDDGSVDFNSADSLVEFHIEKGISGMTILGVMGEANKMSGDEADGFMRHMLKRVDGRAAGSCWNYSNEH